MSNNPGGKKKAAAKNPLLNAEKADRKRKFLIQGAVAVVLIGLVAAIGIGIAVKNAEKNDPGPTPSIPTAAGQNGTIGSLTDAGAVRIGKPEAKVTVRVVADLQCPACKAFEAANSTVVSAAVDTGTAAVEYNIISFLDKASTNKYSSRAANASYCVAESDPSKYLGWLTTMFEQQPAEGSAGHNDDQLIQIAENAGYTDPAVAECISDNKYRKYVQARTKDVLSSGVESTPTVFVNGQKISNDTLAAAIAAAAGQ